MAGSNRDWTRMVTRAAVGLGIGAVAAALAAAVGSASGLWGFGTGEEGEKYRIEPSFTGILQAYYGAGMGDWNVVWERRAQPGDTLLVHADYPEGLNSLFHGHTLHGAQRRR